MKMLLSFFLFFTSCVLVGCGNIATPDGIVTTGSVDMLQTGSLMTGDVALETGELGSRTDSLHVASSLWQNGVHRPGDVVVTNIEQVTYAIALPLSGFTEEFDESYQRAQHVFVSTDPESHESISVQGFIVDSEDEFTLQKKFERMQNDMRESGLNPTDGEVNEAKDYFVINGKLPNLPDQMYTDIYFYFACKGGSAFTDSVAVSMVYDKADAAKRQEHSEFIQQAGVQHVCE